jgi:hypothetical protein
MAPIDLIRSAALALVGSIRVNPCPDPVLSDRLEVVAARYRFAVLQIELAFEQRDEANLQSTVDRLDVLNAELKRVLAVRNSA